jgi:hypothetical protein
VAVGVVRGPVFSDRVLFVICPEPLKVFIVPLFMSFHTAMLLIPTFNARAVAIAAGATPAAGVEMVG